MQTTLGNKSTQLSGMMTPVSNSSKRTLRSYIPFTRKTFEGKGLLLVVIVLQIIMILIFINPSAVVQQIQNNQLLSEVGSKVSITSSEAPIIATVTNADDLRNANGAQAQIYKDAQAGDHVIGYSDRLIIYRRSTGQVIYDGVTPSGLVNETQNSIIQTITQKAKDAGFVPSDSTEVPQISLITDIDTLKQTNPEFYGVASNNDIVGLFAKAQVIVIYNQENDTIINSGAYSTSIRNL